MKRLNRQDFQNPPEVARRHHHEIVPGADVCGSASLGEILQADECRNAS